MIELSKYCKSESVTMQRSEIRFADYNPRKISEEAKKTLKKGIKKYGMVGGIVVNKRTGNTLVQGHQRLSVMDELQKYDPVTHENDYAVRCDLVDLPEKEEKELVILLNNPNAQGEWDYDALRDLMPQIDYKAAGLTDADLSMIGLDFEMPTVGNTEMEQAIAAQLMPSLAPNEETDEEGEESEDDGFDITDLDTSEPTFDEKVQHMKDVKRQVREQAMERAASLTAYVTLSFDNQENMADFLDAFGLPQGTYVVKGEELMAMLGDMELDEEPTE